MRHSASLAAIVTAALALPMPAFEGIDAVPGIGGVMQAVPSPHPNTPSRGGPSGLRVQDVHLEAAPSIDGLPSSTLRFNLVNSGRQRLTDVRLDVSVAAAADAGRSKAQRRLLVGPFRLRASVVLEPGYIVTYAMRLKNLASDVPCEPTIDIVAVRALPDDGAKPHPGIAATIKG